jgi:hypothetical protein
MRGYYRGTRKGESQYGEVRPNITSFTHVHPVSTGAFCSSEPRDNLILAICGRPTICLSSFDCMSTDLCHKEIVSMFLYDLMVRSSKL